MCRTIFRQMTRLYNSFYSDLKTKAKQALGERIIELDNFLQNKECVYRYETNFVRNETQYTARETKDQEKKEALVSKLCYAFNHECLEEFMKTESLNQAFIIASEDLESALTASNVGKPTIDAVHTLVKIAKDYKLAYNMTY